MRNMLRKITVLLAAMAMMGVMGVSPALAGYQAHDGADANQGGGQEKPKNEHRKGGLGHAD